MQCSEEWTDTGHGTLWTYKTDRKGIGRSLFETMRKDYDRQEFTVNSSPYAVEVYRHLGFKETDTEQTVNGLRFTPMRLLAMKLEK